MLFRILGPPDLYDETGDRSTPLNAPKTRLLLGTLLTRPNVPVPRETLVRELWGTAPPRQAPHTLNAHVSALRASLLRVEPERRQSSRLVARASGYALLARPSETDVGRFGRALSGARRTAAHDPEGTYRALRRGLALWRGPVLGGGAHGPACARLAARLERERQDALALYFDCALRTRRHAQAVPELQDATAAHPLDERLHDQLMLALCRCGRGPEAIGVYQRARRRLAAVNGHTPLLTARLEQISVCSPVLTDPAAEHPGPGPSRREPARYETPADPLPRSVLGYLTDVLSGQVLSSS
ncbi:BTAD domain-containing putative transcriptional regulator [Streptomyces sp. NPDC007904]|jgi:DNA-binding SARP family transcriptional activator|uniref:AfsR/SARP family transcriptional regulator n=1 Tax=Streptomyces sp. NPDC007904 TaxID=3364787 RepID=UPI0036E391E1